MNLIWVVLLILVWSALAVWLYRRDRRQAQPNGLWMDVLAGGLLFVLVLGFFWRTLSGAVYQPADGGDLVSFLFPSYRFAASELAQGRLPLWNPTLYAGAPFVGDIQAGFLYPPNLILFLANADFPYAVMQWLVTGHLYWAGLGTYVLMRTLRWPVRPVSRPAALFAALVFAFADPLLIHLGNLNLIAVLSWMPWVLAAFANGLQRASLRWAAAAGLLFGVSIYAGHAQSTMYVGMALALLALGWAATAIADRSVRVHSQWRTLGMLLVAVILAALLASPILLPALELAGYTARAEFTYQDTVAYSLAPTQLLAGLVTPSLFGRGPALHWSLWERVELPYLGIAALILALCGVVLAFPEQRRLLWTWVGMALFGVVVSLGIYTVIHGWLTMFLPMFDQFRAPARAVILWTMGASVVAAVGFDAVGVWAARANVLSGILKAGAAALGVGLLASYTLLFTSQADTTVFLRVSLASLALAIALASWLATWALIAARQARRLTFHAFAFLMLALLYIELAAAGAYTDISETTPTQGFRHDDVITFLHADTELFRIDTRTDLEGIWQPDTAALAGLQDVGGISNPLALRAYKAFWESTGGRDTRRYDLLNVKYVLVKEGTPLPEKFVKVFGPSQGVEVYENTGFLPRAWVAPAGADLHELAALGNVTAASVQNYSPTGMSFSVQTPDAGWLIISEMWYPGWTATVNGAETPIEPVNEALRGVAIPAGESTVTLSYQPASFRWGIVLGALGVVALVAFVLIRSRSARAGSA